MFITNELTPAEILAELIKGRRTSVGATRRFVKLKHDKDLVPHFTEQIDSILDVYKAYEMDAHDIQGIRDDGVDLLLRFDHDDVQRRVGLQIKSNDEFDQWAKKKLNMVEKLKAQYSAARENARVDYYYVLICADDRAHRKRVRTVCSEFKNFRHCTVIEPRDALGFYDMSPRDLMVRTTRLLCDTDVILRQALREADSVEADVAFFLTSLVCHAFFRGTCVEEENLVELWSQWSELAENGAKPNDHMADIFENLVDDGVLEFDRDRYVIDTAQLPSGLCALFFDLRVRKLESDTNIRDYIVGLLELKDRAISELEEDNEELDVDDE